MRKLTALFLAANCLIINELAAQIDPMIAFAPVPDRPAFPIFPTCQKSAFSAAEQKTCADSELLKSLARAVIYPTEARETGIQGMVILQFLVEKDGTTSGHSIAKDPGAGCGAEALRAFLNLEKEGLRWSPAKMGPDPIASKMSVPVRFRLQEVQNWRLTERGDTVFDRFSEAPSFKMGTDSLVSFIIHKTNYPSARRGECVAGHVELELLVKRDGSVRVENVIDFHGLGPDFEFEAIRTANQMTGLFRPAKLDGRSVGTVFPMQIAFKSSANECALVNEKFDLAMVKSDSAIVLRERGENEKAIEKATESLVLAPKNAEMLYLRGLMFFEKEEKSRACEDWNLVKKLLGTTWFEQLRRLACGF